MTLLPVAEAQARLLALATPLPIEHVSLTQAAGRWAAREVQARRTQPAADLSAMDGYAIRFFDLPGPFALVGESRAGGGLERPIQAGEAARIFTGAPLPPGADTILVQEDASLDGGVLRCTGEGPPGSGAHVRQRGTDFGEHDLLIAPGLPITPARIGLVATGGHGSLPVHAMPRVALLSTGDELVAPGTATSPGQLPASNAVMLQALIGARATVADRGIVPDDLGALVDALLEAEGHADVVVTSGGASVGDHDLVRPAIERAGGTLDFWRVAMRPGKPLIVGRLGGALILGLPGNPVSTFVTASLFLLPLLARLAGAAAPLPVFDPVPLTAPLGAGGTRDDYLRARIERGGVRPLVGQDSAGLVALAEADALLLRQAGAPALEEGVRVPVLRLA